jgi:hypothetical protein
MGDDDIEEGPVDWTGDPLRDMVTYRWIENGRAALETVFLDDDVRARYEDWIARRDGAAGEVAAGGDTMVVAQWSEGGGSAVILSAGGRRNEFALDVLDGAFEASVALVFGVEAMELLLGTLARFSGHPEAALIAGADFQDTLAEEGAALDDRLAGLATDGQGH